MDQRHALLVYWPVFGAGFNRSALLAGLILTDLGWKGSDAVSRLRERRPGALFNERFAAYLGSR